MSDSRVADLVATMADKFELQDGLTKDSDAVCWFYDSLRDLSFEEFQSFAWFMWSVTGKVTTAPAGAEGEEAEEIMPEPMADNVDAARIRGTRLTLCVKGGGTVRVGEKLVQRLPTVHGGYAEPRVDLVMPPYASRDEMSSGINAVVKSMMEERRGLGMGEAAAKAAHEGASDSKEAK